MFICDYVTSFQVSPGSVFLMRVVEDFIHLIGEAQKPFQSFLVVTNNLSEFPWHLRSSATNKGHLVLQ